MAGVTGEYLDPFNRGQWSSSWNIERGCQVFRKLMEGRHGCWISTEQNVHMRNEET